MKLLTFLGVAKYEETTYTWNGQAWTTPFSFIASCHFLKPASITLFLTEEAQQMYAERIARETPPEVGLDIRPVSHGENEAELWQIFTMVSDAVRPGEEVAFDVTNGLRSFPLVGLLVSAFLQFGLGVHLKAVLYGAYDVRDQSTTPSRTPIFDLTPMIKLLEWSAAADRFNRTGDARYLATLVREPRKAIAAQDPGGRRLAGALGNLAGTLDDISQSLRLIRPFKAMKAVENLPGSVDAARPALEQALGTLPFSLLLNQVEQSYAALGMADPLDESQMDRSLEKQRAIIQWYLDREQWVQAVTLMREWLISWFMVRLGQTAIVEGRKSIEDAINCGAYALRNGQENTGFPGLPDAKQALDIWNSLFDLRNDIDHAGMRPVPREHQDLISQINKVNQRLQALPVG